MGLFITFEGVEGCGKTTQIRLLAEQLTGAGHRVVLTREPGGCAIADKIRTILLDAENRAMVPMTELMLYAAARAQHVAEVIQPALLTGSVVLCDRFCDATIAYQSGGRGIDAHMIDTLNELACRDVRPDLTLLIDCDPVIGLARAQRRIETTSGPREERFELEEMAFHQRVRASYLQLAADDPGRFITIDGSGSPEAISAHIAALIIPRIGTDNRYALR